MCNFQLPPKLARLLLFVYVSGKWDGEYHRIDTEIDQYTKKELHFHGTPQISTLDTECPASIRYSLWSSGEFLVRVDRNRDG